MRNQNYHADRTLREIIVQGIKIWRAILANSTLHFRISRIQNFASKHLRLALQLKWRRADRTNVIDGSGIPRRDIQFGRFARRTEEVEGTPGFRSDSCPLRGAPIAFEAFNWEMQIHAAITSRLNRGAGVLWLATDSVDRPSYLLNLRRRAASALNSSPPLATSHSLTLFFQAYA